MAKAQFPGQRERVRDPLKNHVGYSSEQEWLEAVLVALPVGEPLQPETLELLEAVLRPGGSAYLIVDRDPDAHVSFWKTLADRYQDIARLRGLQADTLLVAGRPAEALPMFVETFERDPREYSRYDGSVHDLIRDAGGALWLRDQLALLRRELDRWRAGESSGEEETRELYGALLAQFRGDPDAVRRIRQIGSAAPAPLEDRGQS